MSDETVRFVEVPPVRYTIGMPRCCRPDARGDVQHIRGEPRMPRYWMEAWFIRAMYEKGRAHASG